MTKFQPGESVNVAIDNAIVVSDDGSTLRVRFRIDAGYRYIEVDLPDTSPYVTVEKVARAVSA